MAQYFAVINSTDRYQLFYWDANSFRGDQQLHLATDDLVSVKASFENVEMISIVNEEEVELATFTEFDSYSSINYLGRNYSSQLGGFANELAITLTKADLISQVQRLDNQINQVIDTDSMTLEQYKEYKVSQFSKQGEALIFAGTDVELTDGTTKNFTYNLEDQTNLLNAIFIIQALDDLTITIPYHGHGEACELYSALDILAVYISLQIYSTTLQTMVNMRNNWVRACETKAEAEAITFESELPTEWQTRANEILVPAMTIVENLRAKYFPQETTE